MTLPAVLESAPTIDPMALARKKDSEETIGERLARLRRERGMTQVELAERLGVVQPVVSDYERGELRLHGQLIVELTKIIGVSANELLGLEESKSNGSIKNRRLLRRIQELERLPRRDQQAILRTLDAFLAKAR
ncbi:MAG: helix-turn-helix domain-containing protein [Gammaproteobacteria bacterium]